MRIGAYYKSGFCDFTVWAPLVDSLELKVLNTVLKYYPMLSSDDGCWTLRTKDVRPGSKYLFRVNQEAEYPDPASFSQPQGVHSASVVIDHNAYTWTDQSWQGIDLCEYIIYELHVGTFSSRGTFESVIGKLDYLKGIGINAIEIMPIAQFPGERNWGYDGVYPFAVQNSYGGCDGLKKLVNAAHEKGLAVILDVVYNHLGPEGNYLWAYGPYFNNKYKCAWGDAINFDGEYSYGVREYFIQNSLYWFECFHIDALRIDAVHGIYDFSAKHILAELAERVEAYSKINGRKRYLIAESDLNDSRIVKPSAFGGFNIDAQWSDDFHHALHTISTNESFGYYCDFGNVSDLAKSFKQAVVYDGIYSKYRRRYHGNSFENVSNSKHIVFSQNHDQIGNRANGERLSTLVSFEQLKLIAASVLLSPYIPLIFMGEEYAEENPFLYFVSHSDEALIDAVRKGRRKEFALSDLAHIPDPQSLETFVRSKLDFDKADCDKYEIILRFYKEIIRIRKDIKTFQGNYELVENGGVLGWIYRKEECVYCVVCNFSKDSQRYKLLDEFNGYSPELDSASDEWCISVVGKETEDLRNFVVLSPFSVQVLKKRNR